MPTMSVSFGTQMAASLGCGGGGGAIPPSQAASELSPLPVMTSSQA